jgi:hypothetical protein
LRFARQVPNGQQKLRGREGRRGAQRAVNHAQVPQELRDVEGLRKNVRAPLEVHHQAPAVGDAVAHVAPHARTAVPQHTQQLRKGGAGVRFAGGVRAKGNGREQRAAGSRGGGRAPGAHRAAVGGGGARVQRRGEQVLVRHAQKVRGGEGEQKG